MTKQKFMIAAALLTAMIFGVQASAPAFEKRVKKQATFKVRIVNIAGVRPALTN